MHENYFSSTSSPTLVICSLFDDIHSDRFELVSHCGFWVSLIISDVEHFFMCPLPSICFLPINVYSDPLFISSIRLFFIFSSMNSLCILDISPISDILFENITSHLVVSLFILLIASSVVLSLWGNVFIFAFLSLAWRDLSKNILLRPMSAVYCPMPSSRSFRVSGVQVFNPFYLCLWCKKLVQFYSFAFTCPIFQAPFIEDILFSLLYSLASFVTVIT